MSEATKVATQFLIHHVEFSVVHLSRIFNCISSIVWQRKGTVFADEAARYEFKEREEVISQHKRYCSLCQVMGKEEKFIFVLVNLPYHCARLELRKHLVATFFVVKPTNDTTIRSKQYSTSWYGTLKNLNLNKFTAYIST